MNLIERFESDLSGIRLGSGYDSVGGGKSKKYAKSMM
jgi:hypothetical protein